MSVNKQFHKEKKVKVVWMQVSVQKALVLLRLFVLFIACRHGIMLSTLLSFFGADIFQGCCSDFW